MKILFTGGGTMGHVSLNIALIPLFQKEGWETIYIGSQDGIEKTEIKKLESVPYYTVSTGKLRRYMSMQNVKDIPGIFRGIAQARSIIKREKPDIVFAKGGFVSVPVIIGARLNKIPVVLHESDISIGLANKLAYPFVSRIYSTFPEIAEKHKKAVCIGSIIRDDLKTGDVDRGMQLCGFNGKRPIMLVMGGSLGAMSLNRAVWSNLDRLTEKYQIVHLCGKNNFNKDARADGYAQFEFVREELYDILAVTDFVFSRAGANTIFEMLYFKKPMILVPLPLSQSRGDQILNAQSFEKKGYCKVIRDQDLPNINLPEEIDEFYANRQSYISAMPQPQNDGLQRLFREIKNYA
ncbi:MAG: undecaprenyldiphospho-muramoylpentapeptide beta-N-acetylglucosaminyltransferase [Oscillospiraceae bacterium]|nr:undecaprenyldiphospho-muramoylpentapeptide beta-N-acetylglucosaminyltransferase [Oscillospiraceae bacterium]